MRMRFPGQSVYDIDSISLSEVLVAPYSAERWGVWRRRFSHRQESVSLAGLTARACGYVYAVRITNRASRPFPLGAVDQIVACPKNLSSTSWRIELFVQLSPRSH
jgi:hypothetical protein